MPEENHVKKETISRPGAQTVHFHFFGTDAQKRWRKILIANRVLKKWKKRSSTTPPPSKNIFCILWLPNKNEDKSGSCCDCGCLPRWIHRRQRVAPSTASPSPQPPEVPLMSLERKMRHTWNLMRWRVRATAVFRMLNFSGGGGRSTLASKVHPALIRNLETAAQQQRLKSIARLRQAIGDMTINNGEEAKNLQSMMENRLQAKMDFNLKEGDIVLANFDLLENSNSRQNSLTWSKPLPRGPVFDTTRRKKRRKAKLEMRRRLMKLQGETCPEEDKSATTPSQTTSGKRKSLITESSSTADGDKGDKSGKQSVKENENVDQQAKVKNNDIGNSSKCSSATTLSDYDDREDQLSDLEDYINEDDDASSRRDSDTSEISFTAACLAPIIVISTVQ